MNEDEILMRAEDATWNCLMCIVNNIGPTPKNKLYGTSWCLSLALRTSFSIMKISYTDPVTIAQILNDLEKKAGYRPKPSEVKVILCEGGYGAAVLVECPDKNYDDW